MMYELHADVRSEEIASYPFDLKEHVFDVLETEMHRTVPHGPIVRIEEYNFKLDLHTLYVVAEWKEPVQ